VKHAVIGPLLEIWVFIAVTELTRVQPEIAVKRSFQLLQRLQF
jgi:hypothetical protein